MLWQRVLTAALLLPLLIAALFYLPPVGIAILLGFFMVLAAWELGQMLGFARVTKIAYVAAVASLGAGACVLVMKGYRAGMIFIISLGVMWWFYAIVHIFMSPTPLAGVFRSPVARAFIGILSFVPAWTAFFLLYLQGLSLMLYVLALVMVADSAAYGVGRAFGRHKLAPRVSPGKSIEGLIGALVATVMVALGGHYYFDLPATNLSYKLLIIWVILALITVIFSVVGDLNESIMKRIAGVKDSGKLLPGHGGVYDRIDALLAAAPVFAFGLLLVDYWIRTGVV